MALALLKDHRNIHVSHNVYASLIIIFIIYALDASLNEVKYSEGT